MRDLSKTGALPPLQAALESIGLRCEDALQASELANQLDAAQAFHPNAQGMFARCESPIERQFLIGAFLNDRGFVYEPNNSSLASAHWVHRKVSTVEIALYPQTTFTQEDSPCCPLRGHCGHDPPIIGRVDFVFVLIRHVHRFRVAIELDGKEFHGEPKQAERDHARDRLLLSQVMGPDCVVRFSGSEVYGNAVKCFSEALEILFALEQRSYYRTRPLDDTLAIVEVAR